MSLIIEIQNRQKKIALNLPLLNRQIRRVLKEAGLQSATLSVVFVTDRIIRALNKRFLQDDVVTDVLAFDFTDNQASYRKGKVRVRPRVIDGEIVISVTTAVRQSRMYHTTFDQELLLYVIHGILHLLGYDDHAPNDIVRMRRKETQWLNKLSGPAKAGSPAGGKTRR